jgi:autotransporter-associated beta strand protein
VTAGGTSVSSTISSGGTTNNYIRIGTNVAAGATIFNVADSSGNANTDLTISAQLRDSRQLNSPFNEVAGALTKSGVGTLTLSGANAYSGGTTINNGILSADTFTAAGSNSSIGTGALTLNGGTFRYTGASSNANDVLINRTINVGTNGGTLEISSSGNYFGYGGSFSGSGTLTVTGSNKELLYTGTSSGNFTGNIIVGTASANSGLVQYRSNNANAFGTGSITINAGGTFSADSGNGVPSTLANNFILNGGLLATQFPAMTYGGTISLLATSTIGNVATYNGTLASTGAISGSGGVIISSGSSVTLSGNNTYSGGTTVNAGTLKLGHVSALGATSGTVNLNGGTLDLNGQSVTQSAVVFNGGVQIATGSGTLSLSGTGTAISFTGTPTTASATGTISLTGVSGGNIIKSTTAGAPVLSGALNLGGVSRTVALADTGGDLLELSLTNQVSNGGLTLDNGFNSTSTEDWGTLGLLGTNTYDGITTITKGRVVIDNASSLGSAVGGTTIGTRGTLAFGGAGVTIASGITVAEALTISRNNTVGQYGSAAIQNNSGANTMSGAVSLTANATIDVVGGSLQFSNTISQTATSSLTKIGTGTLTLSGENAYSGGTTLSGGTLAVRNNSALGTGTLNMGTGTALTNSDTAAHSLTNNIVFGSGTGMAATLFANSDLTLNGALSGGSSGIQISVQGPGTVTVANSPHNLGSGAAPAVWTVTGGGTLALTQGNNFGNLPSTATTQVILNNGTFKTIAANAVFFSSRGMQVNAAGGTWHDSAGGVGFDGAIANSGPFTVNTSVSNATSTLNGAVSGSGSLIKTGAGTLTLSATNGFNGATMVNEGTLRVTGSITNSAVTVSNAGTTIASGSTGTIGSSLTVNSGAILAAGDAAATGTATVTGATTLNNGSIFSWDISSNGTGYDKLVTASLAGDASPGDAVFRIVAADSTFANTFWNQSRTWTDIFTTDGSNAISDWAGLFTVAVVNSSFQTVSPVNGSFSVSGSTLTWSAVPEVSSVLVGGLLGLGLLRRRRDGGRNFLPRKETSRSSLHN